MEVSRIRALRGPNLWSRHTAIQAIVECSEAERSIDSLPGFEARLRERFPEIDFLNVTGHDEVISLAHTVEFAALGLQAQAGCPVTFSRTSETLDPGIYQVVVEYTEESVGRLAIALADSAVAVLSVAEMRHVKLRDWNADQIATFAADHLAVGDVLAEILANLAAYNLFESRQVVFDSHRAVLTFG